MNAASLVVYCTLALAAPPGTRPIIDTVAGNGKPGNDGAAGPATEMSIDQPFGVEIGPEGALYVTEVGTHRIRRVDLKTGALTTVAGNGRKGYAGDGGPATEAALNEPYEVRFDRAGNIIFVEMQNHIVRRVDAKTGVITTVAGTGRAGFGGDGGPATKAEFSSPHSIALDRDDNIYIADILNHRIRRVDAKTGVVETIAGTGEKKLPDESKPARGQPIHGPRALYIVGDTLWIALREGNSVWTMSLVDGQLKRVAGTGKKGFSGDGGPPLEATFDGPKGIAVDSWGMIYVVDTENQTIRLINPIANTISTFAGVGPKARGFAGDGGPATAAHMDRPHGIGLDRSGTIYIGDTNNHRVRRVPSRLTTVSRDKGSRSVRVDFTVAGGDQPSPQLAVRNLRAESRLGQVFLTWDETDSPPGATFSVYLARQGDDLRKMGKPVGHHIEPHSARDWWQDPASFTKSDKVAAPAGYTITAGEKPLNPNGGLFVYSGWSNTPKSVTFAVVRDDLLETTKLVPDENVTSKPVTCVAAPAKPIWQLSSPQPPRGAGRGKGLALELHAKGGVVANPEYLVFGDESLGWRAGLPFKFSVRIENDLVVVRPTDRVWINRPHDEAGDGGTPAIWSFWYGYNSKIYDRSQMSSGVPTNYTERRLLWILNWVSHYYETDPNRWYCSGSSMGGCGTISFGLRHPELFAALHAHVPIVSYTYAAGPKGSMVRFEPCCWVGPIPETLKCDDERTLFDRMNSVKYVSESRDDLPPLFIMHGRQDGSIPWVDNPPFYREMTTAKQPLTVYWDNGTHSESGKDAPADVKAWKSRFRQYRRDESVVVFTNASSSKNPGDGRSDNGDIIGWINRGLDYREPIETADQYSVTLMAAGSEIEYPLKTDITVRRRQRFQPAAGEKLRVTVGDAAPVELTMPADGLLTVPGVSIPSTAGVKLAISRAAAQ